MRDEWVRKMADSNSHQKLMSLALLSVPLILFSTGLLCNFVLLNQTMVGKVSVNSLCQQGGLLALGVNRLNTLPVNTFWQKVSIMLLTHLFDAWNHSDTGRDVSLWLGKGNNLLSTKTGNILPLNLQDLVSRLQSRQVSTASLFHSQDVAGPVPPYLKAKLLWPALVGCWHGEDCEKDGKSKDMCSLTVN